MNNVIIFNNIFFQVNIEKFLMDSLNGYLKMRQQRLAATEITNMIDRRLRMNEGMGGGTIGNR